MSVFIEDNFKNELNRVDMLRPEGEPTSLYFVTDKRKIKNPHIRIALEQAESYEADAIFFRMFPAGDNRSPIPQVYLYNKTTLSLDKPRFAEIHRRLWNAGIVPLMFIFTAGEIKVLNCRQEPEVDKDTQEPVYRPFHALEKLITADQAFASREISAGTLWENPKFKNDFVLEKTAYYKLLSYLKAFRVRLVEQKKLTKPVINRLLVMSILVKYLNDRQDSKGNRVFQEEFFYQFSHSNARDLASLFREPGGCIRLFEYLSRRFNGRIFELSESEREALEKADLSPIADFLEGTRDPAGQGLFWPLYSFEDLPVELISNIYEEFLAKQDKENSKGVVYTPPMLVDFLLNQCLPLDPKSLDWKILDPACGSGVFLVGAFKRLIQCWRIANDWKTPTHLDLQGILKNNLYGFDKAPEAVLITAFSLCVALCDELEPLVIWNELRFDDLRNRNLQAKDFFEVVESGEFDNYFDLVIGNPPFESPLTTNAAERVEIVSARKRPSLPDKQLALLFLEQSFQLVKDNAEVCLIQPAGPLLYNGNALPFRGYLFDKYDINCVFDFTSLEGALFKAKVAAAAVIGYKSPSSTNNVLHVTFRRTKAIKEKLLFELDPYDFHWIDRKAVLRKKIVWKANLLGGGRLHRMLERLFTEVPTLGEYLEQKREHEGWQFGEGYSVGCGSYLNKLPNAKDLIGSFPKELKRQFKLKRTPKIAPWITGKKCVPPEALTSSGIDQSMTIPCRDFFFEEPRRTTRPIFSPPHVLIREKIDGLAIPSIFSKEELVFTNQIVGVYAPDNEQIHLQVLAERLNESKLYGILAILVSGRILVGRSNSLYASDILALPYPDDMQDIDLNFWEQALVEDIGNYLVDFRRKGEKASVLNKVNDSDLLKFGEMYCRILNPVYKQFRPMQPLRFGSFVCYPICYGDAPQIDLPETDNVTPYLEQLLHRQHGSRLFVNRILRLYEENVIFMIKPDQKRYWLSSVALRDADETLVDLLKQGY